jgi:5-methylcytosine-specific restriction enzyme A
VSPTKPKHPCNTPGCSHLTSSRFCPKHTVTNNRLAESCRVRPYAYLYGRLWQVRSAIYKSQHPVCEECMKRGIVTPAYAVDHKVPHKGDLDLFWDEDNWQSLCEHDHNVKTAKEEGGFGNRMMGAGV